MAGWLGGAFHPLAARRNVMADYATRQENKDFDLYMAEFRKACPEKWMEKQKKLHPIQDPVPKYRILYSIGDALLDGQNVLLDISPKLNTGRSNCLHESPLTSREALVRCGDL